jgi:hypothetical protein
MPASSDSNALPDARRVLREWTPSGLPDLEQEPAARRQLPAIDPTNLRKYEGSLTTEEILSASGGSATVPLDSRWVHPGSNHPQVRVKIRKNGESGNYEPVGGEVELPSGLGISYEEDVRTGEQKTFLKLKKEF